MPYPDLTFRIRPTGLIELSIPLDAALVDKLDRRHGREDFATTAAYIRFLASIESLRNGPVKVVVWWPDGLERPADAA